MTNAKDDHDRRHSKALDAELIKDPQRRAEAEALNGLKQFDLGLNIIETELERGAFKLRVSTILSLHRAALDGISAFAGNFRPAGVAITGSAHTPPDAHLVAELVEEMCDYVNDNWDDKSAVHLSAYCMWRLNWIHPFADGNGRTSRILSYVVLSIKVGYVLPGDMTIPEQIERDRGPYFAALDDADKAQRSGGIDVTKMETVIGGLLANQLTRLYEKASGKPPD